MIFRHADIKKNPRPGPDYVTLIEFLTYHYCKVFRWGHSRSRASPFYLKLKRNVSEIYWFYKTREIERVRGRESDISPSLSHSRSLALALSSLAFFKTGRFQTSLGFSCENLAFLFLNMKARHEIASGPKRNTILLSICK